MLIATSACISGLGLGFGFVPAMRRAGAAPVSVKIVAA
jgi:hypothetical protein